MKRPFSLILLLIGATIAIVLVAGGFFVLLSINNDQKVEDVTENQLSAESLEQAPSNSKVSENDSIDPHTPQRIYEYSGTIAFVGNNILQVALNAETTIDVQLDSSTLYSTITSGMDKNTALPIVLESTAAQTTLDEQQRIRIYSVHDITKTNSITARQIQILK